MHINFRPSQQNRQRDTQKTKQTNRKFTFKWKQQLDESLRVVNVFGIAWYRLHGTFTCCICDRLRASHRLSPSSFSLSPPHSPHNCKCDGWSIVEMLDLDIVCCCFFALDLWQNAERVLFYSKWMVWGQCLSTQIQCQENRKINFKFVRCAFFLPFVLWP